MFIKCSGEIYNVLLRENGGAWVISYESPKAPVFWNDMDSPLIERIETPEEYIKQKSKRLTEAEKKRLQRIQPLLDNDIYISDTRARLEMLKKLSEETGISVDWLRQKYFLYLATGILMRPKAHRAKIRPEFEWALKTYFLSSKKCSLVMTYDLMILSCYTESDGKIKDDAPTCSQFVHYYERVWRGRKRDKCIARDGLTDYQRNHRQVYGSAMAWRDQIGSFQMDCTQADIYLVSKYDRSKVIGRPNIVIAVDTATQMIAGLYVGLDTGEKAVMGCMANIAADKIKWCKRFGIDITEEEWPCSGVMPAEIIIDKGQEFLGGRTDEFLIRFGIERHSLPPFRPDKKGLVEKSFDLLQECYKSSLRGKGVIGGDVQERWSTDYRSQATLTLEEFTKVIIHSVLYLNNGRVIKTGHLIGDVPKTAASLWKYFEEQNRRNLLSVDAQSVYCLSLPRAKTKFTRKGFTHNKLYYAPETDCNLLVGDTAEIAYDSQNTEYVYFIDALGNITPCKLIENCRRYDGCSEEDAAVLRKQDSPFIFPYVKVYPPLFTAVFERYLLYLYYDFSEIICPCMFVIMSVRLRSQLSRA